MTATRSYVSVVGAFLLVSSGRGAAEGRAACNAAADDDGCGRRVKGQWEVCRRKTNTKETIVEISVTLM
ncbi:hypothetical protein ABVT39_008444 [Epinephelus coioides]